MPSVQIKIDKRYQQSVDARWIESVVRRVIASENVPGSPEVSLLVTGQTRVRQLNRDYRGLDENTDVLSFALTESADRRRKFLLPLDGVLRLGEVIVSYPQAKIQAAKRGESIESEMTALIVHGVLHLLGYDHERRLDARRMQAKEKEMLERLAATGN